MPNFLLLPLHCLSSLSSQQAPQLLASCTPQYLLLLTQVGTRLPGAACPRHLFLLNHVPSDLSCQALACPPKHNTIFRSVYRVLHVQLWRNRDVRATARLTCSSSLSWSAFPDNISGWLAHHVPILGHAPGVQGSLLQQPVLLTLLPSWYMLSFHSLRTCSALSFLPLQPMPTASK